MENRQKLTDFRFGFGCGFVQLIPWVPLPLINQPLILLTHLWTLISLFLLLFSFFSAFNRLSSSVAFSCLNNLTSCNKHSLRSLPLFLFSFCRTFLILWQYYRNRISLGIILIGINCPAISAKLKDWHGCFWILWLRPLDNVFSYLKMMACMRKLIDYSEW